MMNVIGGIFKYSMLVLTVLVLSHIIQVKGVTVSQHVENGMNWVSGGKRYTSTRISRVTQQFSSAIQTEPKRSEHEDADGVSKADRNELDSVIKRSAHR